MAAEHETAISLYFKMTAAVFWRNELKIEYGEDNENTKNRLFAILGWLDRANLENLFVASWGDLASYLKFSVSKYVLDYGPSICINYSRFPYEEDTVNEWFDLPSKNNLPQQGEAVKGINVDENRPGGKSYKTQNENAFPDSLKDDVFEVFFHATSHASAEVIFEDRIYLDYGGKMRDFSDEDGFYLSKDFDDALRCAGYRGKSSAVLVFRLKRTELRGDNNEKGYDLTAPDMKREWKEVVSKFRNGEASPAYCQELNEKYQFIEGPMATIPKKKKKKQRKERVSHPRQIDNSYQLCVRTQSAVDLFDRGLHSVVFFV